MAKQETSNIIHNLLPSLEDVNIPIVNIKVDVSTKKTNPLRGDIWISKEPSNSNKWEKNIIALIEAKSKHTTVGSRDWNDAMRQGKEKAEFQELSFFIVTNTDTSWKYYRASDSKEILFDGKPLNTAVGIYELGLIGTQIDSKTINVVEDVTVTPERLYSEKEFQTALYQVKNVYRNCSIDEISKKIQTTITFVVLKYISEQEAIHRTLDKNIMLWDDWRDSNLARDIKATIEDTQKNSRYKEVALHLGIDAALTASHCLLIKNQLEKFQYSGCNFDLYGSVYESFADKNIKKEFGEYYTRRHITKMLSEILLKNELIPRKLKLGDPACGTGGFLTEAYRILLRNYTAHGHFTDEVNTELKKNTFFGYDIKEANISLSKINMCLAGDGHTNISITEDSLMTLESDYYDYVLTNVVLVPDGILESPSLASYRNNLLNEVRIEAVISLHKYVFRPYTTEKTYALILQRKQKRQIGITIEHDVFMYILENDGFQKGDKRYAIRENNIPDLLLNYGTTKCEAPSTIINTASINESNFYNLTPEFYLNYYEGDYHDVEIDDYKDMIKKLKRLNKVLKTPF